MSPNAGYAQLMEDIPETRFGNKRSALRLWVAGVIVLGLIAGLSVLPLEQWLRSAQLAIDAQPIFGRILFVAGFALAAVLMVPGSVLMMSGGFLFGIRDGVLLALLGITVGAVLACLLSRGFLRGVVLQRVAGNPRINAIDRAVQSRAFLVVSLTRLSLLIPYNVLNYIYGLTAVRLTTYALATWVGMIPAVALYVYLGSLAGNVDELVAGDAQANPLMPYLLGAGLIFLVLASYVVHRTATRALQDELGELAGKT